MGFIYFVDVEQREQLVTKDDALNRAALQRLRHLDDVLSDVRDVPDDCIVTHVSSGPGSKPGCVLFPLAKGAEPPKLPGYFPDSQTWMAPKTDNDYWLGFEKSNPPRPESLQRTLRIGGYWCPDGHGRTWCIPVIRGQDKPYGTLPSDYEWGDDLDPAPVLRKEYEQLWKDSARVWDHVYKEDHRDEPSFVAKFVARCLQLNYRIGSCEMNAFRQLGTPIFDVTTMDMFAALAVDYLAVKEFSDAKKKPKSHSDLDGIASSPGTLAGIDTGSPAVEK